MYQEITDLVQQAEVEAEKFYKKNNKTAAVRLRKIMQEIKVRCQEVREAVSASQKD